MPLKVFAIFCTLLVHAFGADSQDPPAGLEARYILAEATKDGAPNTSAIVELAKKHPDLLEIRSKKSTQAVPKADSKVHGSIAYFRPDKIDRRSAADAASTLTSLSESEAKTLILDLRLPTGVGSVRDAITWLDLFLPPGEVAFRILGTEGNIAPTRSRSEPSWQGEIVILVDSDTGSMAEVIAYTLASTEQQPLIFGQPTKGNAQFYSNIHLDDEKVVQFPSAHLLDDKDQPLAGKPIQPDIALRVEHDWQHKLDAFTELRELNLEAVIIENVRPRRSEASLIHGTDPEIPFLLAETIAREGGTPAEDFNTAPKIQDTILRTALDTIIASDAMQLKERVEHVARREWRINETNRKIRELREQERLEKEQEKNKANSNPEE